mmetsp:Transcript_31544/g.92494  ORF Transcript_31544/g.92494 Transcript_31544/m.92494 type:complete len:291 (+) Transcript_31544:292-1164(+)
MEIVFPIRLGPLSEQHPRKKRGTRARRNHRRTLSRRHGRPPPPDGTEPQPSVCAGGPIPAHCHRWDLPGPLPGRRRQRISRDRGCQGMLHGNLLRGGKAEQKIRRHRRTFHGSVHAGLVCVSQIQYLGDLPRRTLGNTQHHSRSALPRIGVAHDGLRGQPGRACRFQSIPAIRVGSSGQHLCVPERRLARELRRAFGAMGSRHELVLSKDSALHGPLGGLFQHGFFVPRPSATPDESTGPGATVHGSLLFHKRTAHRGMLASTVRRQRSLHVVPETHQLYGVRRSDVQTL